MPKCFQAKLKRGPKRRWPSLLPQILTQLSEGMTITEVGEYFDVSKQRISQVLIASGNSGTIKEIREAATRNRKPKLLSSMKFRSLINSWLQEIGYHYCSSCHLAKPIGDFSLKAYSTNRCCRKCNTERTVAAYRNGRTKDYHKRYHTTEKYKLYQRLYQRRYYQRTRGNRC